MSLKSTILDYLKSQYPNWIHKGQLGKLAVNSWGYENENMGRRCRELWNEDKIERKLEKNPRTGVWEVLYRFKTQNSALRQEQTKSVYTRPVKYLDHEKVCCFSHKVFGTHSPECETLKIKQGTLI